MAQDNVVYIDGVGSLIQHIEKLYEDKQLRDLIVISVDNSGLVELGVTDGLSIVELLGLLEFVKAYVC